MQNDRRKFTQTLSDGKEYAFAERNFEDVDFAAIYERTRAAMTEFARKHFDKENLYAHEMQILRLVPTQDEVGSYLGSIKEQKRSGYDSFKVANEEISFEEFDKLLPDKDVRDVMDKIIEIEYREEINDADLAKEMDVTIDILKNIKTKFPAVYDTAKRTIKKKRAKI